MKLPAPIASLTALLALLASAPLVAAPIAWKEGVNYTIADTANRETPPPGKVLVT